MTEHALSRIRERAPRADASEVLACLQAQARAAVEPFAVTITGQAVHRYAAPGHPTLYGIAERDGAIVTVLAAGMEIETATGRFTLPHSGPLRTLGPGIYDLSSAEYHADPCAQPSLSASLATKLLSATPLHAYAASPRLNPDFEAEGKTEFDIGSAAHEIMTGKGRGIRVIEADDYRTKAAQLDRDAARAGGFTPLTRPQDRAVRRMVRAALAQLAAHGIGNPFARGRNEVTLIWERGGVLNRAMVDCLDEANRVAYDLKTTAGVAHPEAWLERAMGHGVDLRAAHYLDGLETLLGGAWTYRFIPLEKEQPHCLSVVQLSAPALFMAQKKIDRARELWRMCLGSGSWPGFSAEIAEVTPRAYHEARWLERESQESDFKQRTGKDVLAAALRWQAPQGVTP